VASVLAFLFPTLTEFTSPPRGNGVFLPHPDFLPVRLVPLISRPRGASKFFATPIGFKGKHLFPRTFILYTSFSILLHFRKPSSSLEGLKAKSLVRVWEFFTLVLVNRSTSIFSKSVTFLTLFAFTFELRKIFRALGHKTFCSSCV